MFIRYFFEGSVFKNEKENEGVQNIGSILERKGAKQISAWSCHYTFPNMALYSNLLRCFLSKVYGWLEMKQDLEFSNPRFKS